MSGPRRGEPKLVREWMAYAAADLESARLLLPAGVRQADAVAYHSQQSAEKALKAWIIHTGRQHPLTHSIRQLLDVIGRGVPWIAQVESAEVLASYVVSARYPGAGDPATPEDAAEAIEIASQVFAVIKHALKQDGIDLELT